jgi:SAM-dependent methyltransferase
MKRQTLEVSPTCWCGNKTYDLKGIKSWEIVPNTSVSLGQCKSCGTIRTLSCEYDDYTANLYNNNLSKRHLNSIETIKKYCTGSVLDIGCNCGEILNALSKYDNYTKLRGIDYNIDAVEYGKHSFGLDLKTDSLDYVIASNDRYDSIIMVHTFEHIINPIEVLTKVETLFNINGPRLLYLCVPNTETDNFKSFGALDPREHCWHFTTETLTALLRATYKNMDIKLVRTSDIWYNKEQIEIVLEVGEQ